jgi:hypothetical protein
MPTPVAKVSGKTLSVEITGISKVNERIAVLARRMPKIAARALNEVAELTMTDSLDLTPVEDDVLRGTGKVFPHAKATKLQATLTYGTDYALAVHEIPPPPQKSVGGRSARHEPPYGTGGQWKFLETAVKKRARTFTQDIGSRMRREMRESKR